MGDTKQTAPHKNKRKSINEGDEIYEAVFGQNSILGPQLSSVELKSPPKYSDIQLKIARWMLLQRMTQCQICNLKCFGSIRTKLVVIKLIKSTGSFVATAHKDYLRRYESRKQQIAVIYTCDLCATTLTKKEFLGKIGVKNLPEKFEEFLTTEGRAMVKRQNTLISQNSFMITMCVATPEKKQKI